MKTSNSEILLKKRTKSVLNNMNKEIRCRFVVRNKDQDGLSTIYLQFRHQGKPIKLPIGVKCKKDQFDIKNQRVRSKHANHVNLNLLLTQKKSQFNDIVIRYTLSNRPLTINLLQQEFLNPESSINFLAFYLHHLDNRKKINKIVQGTYKQHFTTYNVLKDFFPELQFKDINLDFIYLFEQHLIKKKNNNQGTISTRMKNLQVYINLGITEGLIHESPFGRNKYKIHGFTSKITALTLAERASLIDYFFSSEISQNHKNVLQGFLLSCFTGLRYSDLSRVSFNNISSQKILKVKPLKTLRYNKTVEIPLISIVFKIIESQGLLCKKIIQNQPTNRVLKKIGIKLEIETSITTHIGRHTFGSLFIQSGGNVVTLQKLMGHTDIKETMGYVHLHESYIADEMKNFGEMK
jgi:integrase/recombinase XerD